MLLYPGQAVFYGTGQHYTRDWVFSIGLYMELGVTVPLGLVV